MEDFYCEQALSGKTPIKIVAETESVLAYHHTKPHWPVHIVAIPKKHIDSLLTLNEEDGQMLLELTKVVKEVAAKVNKEQGACAILTNLGKYQDSKHLHFHITFGEPFDRVKE